MKFVEFMVAKFNEETEQFEDDHLELFHIDSIDAMRETQAEGYSALLISFSPVFVKGTYEQVKEDLLNR